MFLLKRGPRDCPIQIIERVVWCCITQSTNKYTLQCCNNFLSPALSNDPGRRPVVRAHAVEADRRRIVPRDVGVARGAACPQTRRVHPNANSAAGELHRRHAGYRPWTPYNSEFWAGFWPELWPTAPFFATGRVIVTTVTTASATVTAVSTASVPSSPWPRTQGSS